MPKSESGAFLWLQVAHYPNLSHLQLGGHFAANARPLGTLQIEAVRWEKHDVYGLKSGGNIHTLDRAKLGATGISASIGLADSADPGIIYGVVHTGNGSETRSINTALYPRIQI